MGCRQSIVDAEPLSTMDHGPSTAHASEPISAELHIFDKPSYNPMKTKKICAAGHTFYKSSDCPVCPICAANEQRGDHFLSRLAAPARRALENAGVTTLAQLSALSEKELLQLHGMGKASLPLLRQILAENGRQFKST